jgi:hypothetical protein
MGAGPKPDEDTRAAEIGAGQYQLRAEVPARVFSLAIEADEATARAEHAAFADRCMPLLTRGQASHQQTRQELLRQPWAARQVLAAGGLGYLAVLAGELDCQTRLLLLGVAAAPLEVPDGIDPGSLLAALLRHQYPAAQIGEFPTAHGQGIGIRRCGQLSVPAAVSGGEPFMIDTATSQAMVIFPEARLLGIVTGF